MSGMIDVSGIPKGKLLAALYNESRPLGLGMMQFTPEKMTEVEANEIMKDNKSSYYFDYLKGRVMKVLIGCDELDPRLYDRDNGKGAAEFVVKRLREEMNKGESK